jgi:hypothetical protein
MNPLLGLIIGIALALYIVAAFSISLRAFLHRNSVGVSAFVGLIIISATGTTCLLSGTAPSGWVACIGIVAGLYLAAPFLRKYYFNGGDYAELKPVPPVPVAAERAAEPPPIPTRNVS